MRRLYGPEVMLNQTRVTMGAPRLIRSAHELIDVENSREVADVQVSTLRARFGDFLSDSEWSELAGDYARATADLNRLNRRSRVLRGRIHFDAEVL
ncbi:MAG TPA: hypothetical protein VFW94_23515 [Candidatus Acidoferrales bacterium]|nr:hypothetical protein [Candidatus Acidoferrales bacterium]